MDVERRFIWDGKAVLSDVSTRFQRGWVLFERLYKRLSQVGGGQPRDGDLCAGGFLAVLLGSAPVRRGGRIGQKGQFSVTPWNRGLSGTYRSSGTGVAPQTYQEWGRGCQDFIPIPHHWTVTACSLSLRKAVTLSQVLLFRGWAPLKNSAESCQPPALPAAGETVLQPGRGRSEQHMNDRGEGHLCGRPVHIEPCRKMHCQCSLTFFQCGISRIIFLYCIRISPLGCLWSEVTASGAPAATRPPDSLGLRGLEF